MKKIIFIMLILTVWGMGYAQELTIGARVGGNISLLTGDYGLRSDNIDYSNIDAFPLTYGLFVSYGLTKHLFVQAEINYRTKRFYYNTDEGAAGTSGDADFNYVEIPLLLKYGFGRRVRGFINVGPVINVLVSGGDYNYRTLSTQIGSAINTYARNIKSDFNTLNIGVLGGLGVEWNILSRIVLLGEVRAIYDLSHAASNNNYTDPNSGQPWYYDATRFLIVSADVGIGYRLIKNKLP